MTSPAVIAVDVGGTSMKAGVLGPSGCHALRRVPTGRERGPDAVVATIAGTVMTLDEWCRGEDLDVLAAAVAVPGIVDDDAGVARLSVNLGWRDHPIRDEVDPHRGYPVVLTHDVRAGALAEATFGAAAATGVSMFVPIGTGLAAATVADRRVLVGGARLAGEIGQILLDAPPTGAESPGRTTLERIASATALAERYRRATGETVRPADVLARRAAGDAAAVAIVAEAMHSLGAVLATAVATVDPEVVVLGGGLTSDDGALVEGLATALRDELPWRTAPRVAVARFGADAGFVGTALFAWQRAAGRDLAELADGLDARWPPRPDAAEHDGDPKP